MREVSISFQKESISTSFSFEGRGTSKSSTVGKVKLIIVFFKSMLYISLYSRYVAKVICYIKEEIDRVG